jgi:hypothetical protein
LPHITISYRRIDSQAIAGRIFDRFVIHFGKQSVFMDIDGIPYGADLRQQINNAVLRSDVVIAIIGPQWLRPQADGPPGISKKADPVRVELETALVNKIHVIPVLVDNTKMPAEDKLPATLKQIPYLYALELSSGHDFDSHITRLLSATEDVLADRHGPTLPALRRDPSPKNVVDTIDGTTVHQQARLRRFAAYAIVPIIIFFIGHYVIVMKLDMDTVYLRAFTAMVALIVGALLRWQARGGLGFAIALGTIIGTISVLGMSAIVGVVDTTSIFPSSLFEWQESIEYAVQIVLLTVVGNALARAVPAARFGAIVRRW